MNIDLCTSQMERSAAAISELLAGVSADDARWRPSEKEWSIVEVAGHLLDEETVDFRSRIDLTLNHPGKPWPPLLADVRVTELRFRELDLAKTLADFRAERARSVAWLRGLGDRDWSMAYNHPKVGRLEAGMLLACWVAHDVLHIRQLSRLLFRRAERDFAPYSLDYAGKW